MSILTEQKLKQMQTNTLEYGRNPALIIEIKFCESHRIVGTDKQGRTVLSGYIFKGVFYSPFFKLFLKTKHIFITIV